MSRRHDSGRVLKTRSRSPFDSAQGDDVSRPQNKQRVTPTFFWSGSEHEVPIRGISGRHVVERSLLKKKPQGLSSTSPDPTQRDRPLLCHRRGDSARNEVFTTRSPRRTLCPPFLLVPTLRVGTLRWCGSSSLPRWTVGASKEGSRSEAHTDDREKRHVPPTFFWSGSQNEVPIKSISGRQRFEVTVTYSPPPLH
jgi:hypothetical protein